MLFAQTIRDLFSKINQTNETVSRIDKDSGVMATSQKILIDDFKELKHKCEDHFKEPVVCESKHDVDFLIRDKELQNSKIDKLIKHTAELTNTINQTKYKKRWKEEWKADLIKYVLLLTALFGSVITYIKWADSRKSDTAITYSQNKE